MADSAMSATPRFRPSAPPASVQLPFGVAPHALASEERRLEDSLLAARAGNPVAFEAVYRALAPRLVRYARGLVGQDADDVAAEAWLQIVRDLGRFHGDWDAFRGWAARILRNRAIDHLRAQSRRPMGAAPIEAVLELAGPEDTARAAEESLSTARAVELIATLPPDQAEAVLLRAVVGLDAKGAAAVLGKRPGAVRVAAHRGLKTLAARLESSDTSNDGGTRGAGRVS
ncbi:MAG: polymerase sigma-70 factor, subfamily [Pseudonocardiales bacterium]|jgi:RNA polymerase sigma-70 factor (ECF subfamily)|nr:polymerase sigma-70 factor, subfamily [Pseudonocardiales bacterium]